MSIRARYKKQLRNFCLDVDFEMPVSGITVLFGPSGAGKSSLLNLLSGLDITEQNQETSSTISAKAETSFFEINNAKYDDTVNNIKLKAWQRNIGYVFQDARLFPNMTVEKNILFGFKRRSSSLNIEDVINKFKIRDLLNHYPDQLSGGQKQRVSMVRALLSNPELLILDEPLAALDYQSRQELLPYIESIHKELTIPVIYVSHDIKEVLRLADYIVVMDQGRIIDKGNIAELCINQPLLTQAEGASFILEGVVSKIISEDKLIEIDCGEESILIAGKDLQLNQAVRVLIHAKDVSLCKSHPDDSSILNCVPVIIDQVIADEKGKLQVMAKMGEQIIVSMISHRSARQLEVRPGHKIFAQFKATAMIK